MSATISKPWRYVTWRDMTDKKVWESKNIIGEGAAANEPGFPQKPDSPDSLLYFLLIYRKYRTYSIEMYTEVLYGNFQCIYWHSKLI